MQADLLAKIKLLQNEGEYLINKINGYENEQLNKEPEDKKQLEEDVEIFKKFYEKLQIDKEREDYDYDEKKANKAILKFNNLKSANFLY